MLVLFLPLEKNIDWTGLSPPAPFSTAAAARLNDAADVALPSAPLLPLPVPLPVPLAVVFLNSDVCVFFFFCTSLLNIDWMDGFCRLSRSLSALRRVRPLRRQDGPPLRVAQQLRGLRQPQALRDFRLLPAGLRGALLLRRDGLAGGGVFLAGEPSGAVAAAVVVAAGC